MSEQVEGGGDGITTSLDLLRWVEDGAIPIGFIGVVKYLDDEGVMSLQTVSDGVYPWEVPGLLEFLQFNESVVVMSPDEEDYGA